MKKLKQNVSAADDNLTIFTPSNQSSTVEGQCTEPIPVDLIIDIFLRVPSKSIARFRCVSKSWANILRLPYFTDLFLRKSLNHPRLLFSLSSDDKLYFFSVPQTQNTVANSSLVATRYHTHSLKGFSCEIRYLLQGLVCFQQWIKDYTMTPVMCNPFTGEFITLPEMKATSNYPKTYCGYDPIDKQFKVLCVPKSNRAHVLTLKSGKKLWRIIECTPHYTLASRGICIDGVLYYLAYSAVDCMIVCFNLMSEKFSYIKIDDDDETMIRGSTLVNYQGKLGGVQFKHNRNLRLWLVEQDHAGKYKWSSSIYELNLPFDNFYIVGITVTSDIVLSPYHLSDPFYVFYYNVEGKALTRVEIQGFQEFKCQKPTKVYTFQDYVEDVKLM